MSKEIYYSQEKSMSVGQKETTFRIVLSEDWNSTEEVLEALSHQQHNSLQPISKKLNGKKDVVLVIGDIHEPFTHDEYLNFCVEQYKKHECNRVVFIGDVIDNHFASFHPTDPDGFGGGEELLRAIHKLQKWYRAFPNATVVIGNHDRLIYRKAFSSGIPKNWIKSFPEVLNTPNWEFVDSIEIDNVLYIHGEAGTARTKAKDVNTSVVQGHLHSQAYVEWINNDKFAMQVGTGVDDTKYAFAYNKAGKESILSCGVVKYGKQAILIKM